MTGSRDTAVDMVQEAFYRAWQTRKALQDKDKAFPWLLTILRRCVFREQRQQYRHADTIALLSNTEEVAQSDYHLLDIYSALSNISAAQRDIFLLHHLHGFSYEEISNQLGIPVGTVMSRLSRARDALRKLVENEDSNVISLTAKKLSKQNEKP